MLREILSGKWTVKVMAFVMAVALWLYARNQQTERVWMTARLEIEKPSAVTLLNPESVTKDVQVELQGPRQALDRLRERRLEVRTMIESPSGPIETELRQTIPLEPENVRSDDGRLPGEIRVLSMNPSKVDVTMAMLQETRLKVALKLVGEPAAGHEIISRFVDPDQVTVVGPKVALQSVKAIETMPFDVTGLTDEKNIMFPRLVALRQEVQVEKGGKTLAIPVRCAESVKLFLTLAQKVEQRTFEQVKVQLLAPAGLPYSVKPLKEEMVSVRLRGPKHVLDRMDAAKLVAYVEVGSLKPPGPYSETVKFVLPPGVELDQEAPRIQVDLVTSPP